MKANITVTVTKDGETLKEFKNQTNDFEGFRYLLNNQSQSVSYAVKYGGYDVILKNEETGEIEKYSDLTNVKK